MNELNAHNTYTLGDITEIIKVDEEKDAYAAVTAILNDDLGNEYSLRIEVQSYHDLLAHVDDNDNTLTEPIGELMVSRVVEPVLLVPYSISSGEELDRIVSLPEEFLSQYLVLQEFDE